MDCGGDGRAGDLGHVSLRETTGIRVHLRNKEESGELQEGVGGDLL